jgi:hypothetical protein
LQRAVAFAGFPAGARLLGSGLVPRAAAPLPFDFGAVGEPVVGLGAEDPLGAGVDRPSPAEPPMPWSDGRLEPLAELFDEPEGDIGPATPP